MDKNENRLRIVVSHDPKEIQPSAMSERQTEANLRMFAAIIQSIGADKVVAKLPDAKRPR